MTMLQIQVQLYRPFDREPSDHEYGEPFDSLADNQVGGADKWSSPRNERPRNPRAVIPGTGVSIELHEDGPLFDFVVQHLDQIPDYLSAIASLVSAWIAVRAQRKKERAKDDYRSKSGTKLRVGDLRIESDRDLTPEELKRFAEAAAPTADDRSTTAAGPARTKSRPKVGSPSKRARR